MAFGTPDHIAYIERETPHTTWPETADALLAVFRRRVRSIAAALLGGRPGVGAALRSEELWLYIFPRRLHLIRCVLGSLAVYIAYITVYMRLAL